MIKTLHKMGIKSNHMYLAGIGSVGLALATWFTSKNKEGAGLDRADRWGIFIGEWAPTFFAMGVALRIEETHRELEESEMESFGQAQGVRSRSHAGV
ncbi:hypothetical protein Nocox_30840 [Nonomuraea coxensis DSM 45129]|uniref:Uncharacterized protein n=1 Tax=Nonomuraea coxensis DSM 45129 TaxID=1122611 RepID=A0ABX8U7K2_9ACTN|nr:hypothetical protein [Nonomuraea coxensis]QYC43750.1 hypothetical protein Nocox_30840 [Nonomuraea coxensis DSM 45129]